MSEISRLQTDVAGYTSGMNNTSLAQSTRDYYASQLAATNARIAELQGTPAPTTTTTTTLVVLSQVVKVLMFLLVEVLLQ